MRGRLAAWAIVATGLAATVSCDDEPSKANQPDSRWSTPEHGFCDDVTERAGLVEWSVEETVEGDGADISATCVLTSPSGRVDLVVHSGEQAREQFDHTLSELEDGFTGFDDPVATEPTGWWSEGRRFEAVEAGSVRLTDLVHDGTLTLRLQLVGTPAEGPTDGRQAEARSVADALDAAVADVLDPG
ncbi:hypothetical protein [Nocardioides dilutus]